MSSHLGSGGTVKYFHCPGCQRWTSSCYSEILRADSKMRAHTKVERPPVREKLETWLRSLAAANPYVVLGCSPDDAMSVVREHFRVLARQQHPDVGGSHESMQRLNQAYREICERRATASSSLAFV
jgi:hypothetical protein